MDGVRTIRIFGKHGLRSAHRLLMILKRSMFEFFDDGCPSQAAALAYYTVFSLPPLLLIVVNGVGSVFGSEAVENRVLYQVSTLVGPRAADQINSILSAIHRSGGPNRAAAALGIAAILFAATSAFVQLQSALNQAWNVKPDPRKSEIRSFFVKRLVSFGMILVIAFLMLVSLLLSAALAALSEVLTRALPLGFSPAFLQGVNTVLSFVLFAALFAAMHKFLPDADIWWQDAVAGGIATALLFTTGKLLIGLYLGNSDVTNVYGAAGSLAVILLWTYYSSMILLLGAEFTKVWSQRHGHPAYPEPGAMKVLRREVRVA